MVKTKSIRKFNLWILSAILFCGLTLTACSSASEDNPVSPTQKEVDKNADVDEFYKVAAVAGDPAVVAALNSIPNVTDVKPFMTEAAGQAYYFNYKNYISHDNPSLGTYKQQVVLVYSRADDPVVLHTEGYTLSGIQSGEGNKNRLDKMDFPTFLYTLSKDYADYNNKFNDSQNIRATIEILLFIIPSLRACINCSESSRMVTMIPGQRLSRQRMLLLPPMPNSS